MKHLSFLLLFVTFFSYSQEFDDKINNLIQDNIEEIIELRHWFHENAELSNREFKTAERIAQELIKIGYSPKTEIAKTGVVAILNEGKPGPVVGLRADIDGLPVKERANILSKNMTFKSKANMYYRLKRLLNPNEMGELFKVLFAQKKGGKFSLGF